MRWPGSLTRSLAAASTLLLGLAVCHGQTSNRTKGSPTVSTRVSRHTSKEVSHRSTQSRGKMMPAAEKKKISGKRRRRTASSRKRGQQKIDPQRVHDIQEALIREHYLEGSPSGLWDNTTQEAMKRFQADNDWQSKMIPDSRALIKLGLGPDHAHLLNPETAMTGSDPTPVAAPAPADPPATKVPQPVSLQNTSAASGDPAQPKK